MRAFERLRRPAAASTFRCMTIGRAFVGCAIIGCGLAGCEKNTSDAPAALEPCKAIGQRCEYAPGKLGACVLRDGCQGDDCFVCQSQH